MSKYIPGPRHSSTSHGAPGHGREAQVWDADGKALLFFNDDRAIGPEADANEHLIAAAPDLLFIAQRWAAIDGGSWHVERHAREKAELLADTNTAIAKATGQ